MDIQTHLIRHWQKLLDLRAQYLADALSTKPADRQKLEYAIASIYRLVGLKPPKQMIWFDSQM